MKIGIKISLILTTLISITLLSGCGGKLESENQNELESGNQNGYSLKRGSVSKGDITRTEMQISVSKGEVKMTTPDGQEVKGLFEMSAHLISEDEVLEIDGNGETKVKVQILRDVSEMVFTVAGEVQKETEREPLDGKTIIGRKESGLWKFSLQNGQPTKEESDALEEFARTYDIDDFEYPNDKVSIGDTWEIPEGMIMRILGADMAQPSGSGSCTLKEVMKYKNKNHALIISELKMKGTDTDEGFTMEFSAQGHHYRDMENFIDVDLDYKGQIKISGEQALDDGAKMLMIMSGPLSISGTTSIR